MQKTLLVIPTWTLFFILICPFIFAIYIPFGTSLASTVLILWLYFVGNALKGKLTAFKIISLKWYNIFLIYVLCYIVSVEIFFKNRIPNFLIPLHLLSTVGLFYALFYVARLLVIAEEGKIVKTNRCVGTFILFWFFPIGIWFVHPRVKKILMA
jgi:hypothetical protein